MFELLIIIALSIFAVVMAAAGVGMAEKKKESKKSINPFKENSIEKPVEKLAERASDLADKGRGYVEMGVKELNKNKIVGGAVAGYTLFSDAYDIISHMDLKDMPYGAMAALADAEEAFQNPVKRLGKWGSLAHNIAYAGDDIIKEIDDTYDFGSLYKRLTSLKVSNTDKWALKKLLKNYLKELGGESYDLEITKSIEGGKKLGLLDLNTDKLKVAQYYEISGNVHEQNVLTLLNTLLHEDKEKKLKKRTRGNYREIDVEAETIEHYADESASTKAGGYTNKALLNKMLLYENLKYVLKQEESYQKELKTRGVINKEMIQYLKETKNYAQLKHWRNI